MFIHVLFMTLLQYFDQRDATIRQRRVHERCQETRRIRVDDNADK